VGLVVFRCASSSYSPLANLQYISPKSSSRLTNRIPTAFPFIRADNGRRERYSAASHTLVSSVPDKDSKLLTVARFPIAEVTLFNRHASGYPPAKFRLVDESDIDVQEASANLCDPDQAVGV
jgi:hypothetical protein